MVTESHDHPARRRYEIWEDGVLVGSVTYRISHGVIDLIHTEVVPDQQGRGLAGELVGHVLDDARRRGLGVVPSCPFVRTYIDDRAEAYLDLVPASRRAEFDWTS
jgi:predicted GNAT family acetyltransferase